MRPRFARPLDFFLAPPFRFRLRGPVHGPISFSARRMGEGRRHSPVRRREMRQTGERTDGEEFRHPETAAHLRSLTEAEARRHGLMIREDADAVLEYRVEGGNVRCRRVAAGDMPREAKLLRICEIARDRKGRVRTVTGSVTQSSAIDSAEASGGGMSEFADRLRHEAKRRGTLDSEEVVILSDGAKWIESAMRKVFAGMRTTFVLDIFHLLERLQDALKERVTDGTRRKATFARLKDLIRAGNAALAIEEIAPYGRRWSVDGANEIMAIRFCWMHNRIVDCLQWRAAA